MKLIAKAGKKSLAASISASVAFISLLSTNVLASAPVAPTGPEDIVSISISTTGNVTVPTETSFYEFSVIGVDADGNSHLLESNFGWFDWILEGERGAEPIGTVDNRDTSQGGTYDGGELPEGELGSDRLTVVMDDTGITASVNIHTANKEDLPDLHGNQFIDVQPIALSTFAGRPIDVYARINRFDSTETDLTKEVKWTLEPGSVGRFEETNAGVTFISDTPGTAVVHAEYNWGGEVVSTRAVYTVK